MLQINKKTLNHFVMKKFPNRIVGTDSNGVVLIYDREQIENYSAIAEQFITEVCGWKYLGVNFQKGGYVVAIQIINKGDYREKLISEMCEIIQDILLERFGRNHIVYIWDFYSVAMNSRVRMETLEKICRKVLLSEGRVNLPPMKKITRTMINLHVTQYKKLKIKTNGIQGTRKISIMHKDWKASEQNEKHNSWYYSGASDKYFEASDIDN